MQEKSRCEMLHPGESLNGPLNVVAYGDAQPADKGTVHLRELRPGHYSVGIVSVVAGFEQTKLPVPLEDDDVTTLWEAKGSFVQWPCAWIRLLDKVVDKVIKI